MKAFVFIVLLITVSLTFVFVRLSISMIFWLVTDSKDKNAVFKRYFPYYIIILTALSIYTLELLDFSYAATYYFGMVHVIALLIWRGELKSYKKKITDFAVEPNQTHLP